MTPDDFAAFSTGNPCNADPRVRAIAPAIKPLIPGKRIAGRACSARITPGQNGAIHRAVHHATAGDILVVDGGGSERFGPFGDLLADGCIAVGMVGAVFDCTIRDSTDIAALGFQVFCRGFHPEATAKSDRGDTDVPVVLGGVTVHPGDIVVGDDDGVVVVPGDRPCSLKDKSGLEGSRRTSGAGLACDTPGGEGCGFVARSGHCFFG